MSNFCLENQNSSLNCLKKNRNFSKICLKKSEICLEKIEFFQKCAWKNRIFFKLLEKVENFLKICLKN